MSDYINKTSTSGCTGDGRGKVFAFVNGENGLGISVIAMDEDGNVLNGHICSHPSFGPGDIGCTASDWSGKRKSYAERYPNGYTLEWIDDVTSRPDVMEIIHAANAKQEQEPPHAAE